MVGAADPPRGPAHKKSGCLALPARPLAAPFLR